MATAERDRHRDYQDTPFPNWRNLVPIPAELAAVKPFGDLVLVRVLPEPEMHANLIHLPQRAAGQREQNNKPRVGEVVAHGPGDRLQVWQCCLCLATKVTTTHAAGKCDECACNDWRRIAQARHPMHVKPGDKVFYWRVMANTVEIDRQVYQFIHEESQILAVLESEDGGKSEAA